MVTPSQPDAAVQDIEARADECLATGRGREALELLQEAARLAPGLGRLHAKRGSALMMLGEAAAAVTAFEMAREALPNSPALSTNLGAALAATGQIDKALTALRRAVELRPDYGIGHYNLGRALAQAGDHHAALEAFNNSLAADPSSSQVLIGLGQTYLDLKCVDDAADCFQRALQADPRSAEALLNLGYVAQQTSDLMRAAAYFERATAADPRHYRVATNLASVYLQLGRWSESRRESQRAIQLQPTGAIPRSNLLFGLDFDPNLSRQEIFAAHCEFESFMPSAPAQPKSPRRPAGKVRIGYVSADFRSHACAYFMLPLLRAHDAMKVEVFCYSNSKIEDFITAEFKAVAHWRAIHDLDDKEAADVIASDHIDVLVDCSGHSSGNRLGVFAKRPARYAVAWLGYGNTTGLRAIDYRFTDEVLDPAAEKGAWATEKLIRLPHGFITFDPLNPLPEPTPPPMARRGYVTFGSFNALGKINPGTVALWCRILNAVEGSRIILKERHFDYEDIRTTVMGMFSTHGVGPDRCDLLGLTPLKSGHLAIMNDVDICLDTHPYSGGTTTCDLLLMGVPVVTLYGDRYTARLSASILTRVGLNDLVARGEDAYVRAAVSLAHDERRLASLRASLRYTVAATAVGNPRIFAADVEAAYVAMVEGTP